MGAHAILISVSGKKAINTTIPMAVVEQFRQGSGYPVPVDRSRIRKYFNEFNPDEKHTVFMNQFDDFIIESDSHGQLSALDVAFDSTRERGYFFNLEDW